MRPHLLHTPATSTTYPFELNAYKLGGSHIQVSNPLKGLTELRKALIPMTTVLLERIQIRNSQMKRTMEGPAGRAPMPSHGISKSPCHHVNGFTNEKAPLRGIFIRVSL